MNLSSMRSATHGWIGTGVSHPMLSGLHPAAANGDAARRAQRLRRNQVMNAPPGVATAAARPDRRYGLDAKLLACRMYRSGPGNHLSGTLRGFDGWAGRLAPSGSAT